MDELYRELRYLVVERGVELTAEEVERLESLVGEEVERLLRKPWSAYPREPWEYARHIIGCQLTPDQERLMRRLLEPPWRLAVESGHGVGKTFMEACLVNWFYDTFDPGVCLTIAPRHESLVNVLWSEIRLQRQRAASRWPNYPTDFVGPRAPMMRSSEDHWVLGVTSERGESIHGRHHRRMLFVFDEAEGLDPHYFAAVSSMFQPGGEHYWICCMNPTTLTSPVFHETRKADHQGNPLWTIESLSALNHPNVVSELQGGPIIVPGAVTLSQVMDWINSYGCERITPEEATANDFQFPPGTWWRPSSEAEARILGRRPSRGSDGVWSESLWMQACERELEVPSGAVVEMGVDVARVLGGDNTDIHVRIGPVSWFHESVNGRSLASTAGRLWELANEYAEVGRRLGLGGVRGLFAKDIAIKVDDTGVGGGLTEMLWERSLRAIPVNSAMRAMDEERYPNVRSELWFQLVRRAMDGQLSLSRLSREIRERLRVQAVSATWKLDSRGRRVVESKDAMKKRLGYSPDGMDAMNLAYYGGGMEDVARVIGGEGRSEELSEVVQGIRRRAGLYGSVSSRLGVPRVSAYLGSVRGQVLPGPRLRGNR